MAIPLTPRQRSQIFYECKIGTRPEDVAVIVGCSVGSVKKLWREMRRKVESETGRAVRYRKPPQKLKAQTKRPRRARRVYE